MELTANDLEKAHACPSQVGLFREHFGDGGTVTLAKVRKVAVLFDWDWAAEHLLSRKSLAEYKRVRASALAEYDRATAPALAEYDRITASAWAEYQRVRASAWAEYQRAMALAWYAGWKSDHRAKG